MNIDKVVRKALGKSTGDTSRDMTLYHGTSFANFEKIKKQGLKPQPTMWSHKPSIFLTASKKGAKRYAQRSSLKTATAPVLLKIDMPDTIFPPREVRRSFTNQFSQLIHHEPISATNISIDTSINSVRPNKLMMARINKLPVYAFRGPEKHLYGKEGLTSFFLNIKNERPDIKGEEDIKRESEQGKIIMSGDITKEGHPIDFAEATFEPEKNPYFLHISNPRLRGPERQIFYKAIKKSPHLVTELEKSNSYVVLSAKPSTEFHGSGSYKYSRPATQNKGIIVLDVSDPSAKQTPEITLFHEIKHAQQYAEKPEESKKETETSLPVTAPAKEYFEQPMEKEAEEYAGRRVAETSRLYGVMDISPITEADTLFKRSQIDVPEYYKRLGESIPKKEEREKAIEEKKGEGIKYIFGDEETKDSKILDVAEKKGITYQGTEEEQRQLKRELKKEPELLNVIKPDTKLTTINIESYKEKAAKVVKPTLAESMIPLMVEDAYDKKLAQQSYATKEFLKNKPRYNYTDRTSLDTVSIKFFEGHTGSDYIGNGQYTEKKEAIDLPRVQQAARNVENLKMKQSTLHAGRIILPYNRMQYLIERYKRNELTPGERKQFLEYANRGFGLPENLNRTFGKGPISYDTYQEWKARHGPYVITRYKGASEDEWKKVVRDNPRLVVSMPSKYRTPEIIKEAVIKDPELISVLGEKYLTQEIVDSAVLSMTSVPRGAPRFILKRLPKKYVDKALLPVITGSSNIMLDYDIDLPKENLTPEILVNLIKYQGWDLRHMPANLITPEIARISVRAHGDINSVPEHMLNEDIVRESIKSHPSSIMHIPEKYVTKDIIFEALANGAGVSYIPKWFWEKLTEDDAKKYINERKEEANLGYFPSKLLKNKKLIEYAASTGVQLRNIPRTYLTKDIIINHLGDNNENFNLLQEKDFTPEIAELAASKGISFARIPSKFLTDDIIKKYGTLNPINYKYVPESKFNEEMKRKILMENSYDKTYVPGKYAPSEKEIAQYAFEGSLNVKPQPKITKLPNNYNLANLALYTKKIGKDKLIYNDINQTHLKEKPEVKQLLNQQKGKPLDVKSINEFDKLINDTGGIEYSTEAITKPWGNWPLGYPTTTQLTFLLNVPTSQASKFNIKEKNLEQYNEVSHPRSFDKRKLTLGWIRAIPDKEDKTIRVLEIQSDLDTLGYPTTGLIDVEKKNLAEFVKAIKNNTDYKKIVLVPYHGPGFLPEVYRYMPQRLGFKENKQGWYELDLSKSNRTLYADIVSDNSVTGQLLDRPPTKYTMSRLNDLYRQAKWRTPEYQMFLQEKLDEIKRHLGEEENPEFTKEEIDSIIDEWIDIMKEQTPEDRQAQFDNEAGAMETMPLQERMRLQRQQQKFLESMTPEQKYRFMMAQQEIMEDLDIEGGKVAMRKESPELQEEYEEMKRRNFKQFNEERAKRKRYKEMLREELLDTLDEEGGIEEGMEGIFNEEPSYREIADDEIQ